MVNKKNANPKKRILILTAEMGLGHLMAAKAISATLQEKYGDQCTIKIANPMDDERAPILLRQSQTTYDRAVRAQPDLYRMGYELSDNQISSKLLESAMTLMLLDVLNDLFKEFSPDVVVVTRENYLAPLARLMSLNQWLTDTVKPVPILTTITDLTTVHRSWFNPVTDITCVPTATAYELAIQNGIPANKIQITGVPIDPIFAKPQAPKAEQRARLGWNPDLTTLLVVGGKRVRRLETFLRIVNHSGLPLQLVVVAGGDNELFRHLSETEWHKPTHLYNFVDNMPELMLASDMIACKAGGLVISEALATGLPILLVDVIQGQETGNANYVVEGEAGELALEPIVGLEVLFHWMQNDRQLLTERSSIAQKLGKPQASNTISEMVWNLAHRPQK